MVICYSMLQVLPQSVWAKGILQPHFGRRKWLVLLMLKLLNMWFLFESISWDYIFMIWYLSFNFHFSHGWHTADDADGWIWVWCIKGRCLWCFKICVLYVQEQINCIWIILLLRACNLVYKFALDLCISYLDIKLMLLLEIASKMNNGHWII